MNLLDVFSDHYSAADELTALQQIQALPKLTGQSLVLVDVSGSMEFPNGIHRRLTIAAALAAEIKERSVVCNVYASAGSDCEKRHKTTQVLHDGYLLMMALKRLCYDLGGGGIFLDQTEEYVRHYHVKPDRLYVLTDDQNGYLPTFGKKVFVVDVSTAKYEEARQILELTESDHA